MWKIENKMLSDISGSLDKMDNKQQLNNRFKNIFSDDFKGKIEQIERIADDKSKLTGREIYKKLFQDDFADVKSKTNLNGLKEKDKIEDLSYDEKVKKQDKEIADVENREKEFDKKNTRETGNYGEMKTDQKLRELGYERISSDMVTDIDESGHQGLDGVYYNPNGKPKYIIVDSKYGSAQLNPETKDGKQMSENWIDKRLDQAVGKEKADEIRMEKMKDPDSVGSYVSHVDSEGNVKFDKLDNNANVVEKDVKIND